MKTSREILADVISGAITMQAAAPALKAAMKEESPLILFSQNQDGTYDAVPLKGKLKLTDLFSKPTYKNLSEEEFKELTKYDKAMGFMSFNHYRNEDH